MSNYYEKAHSVECSIARCDEPATTIKLVGKVPVWVCEKHAGKVEGS